MPERPASRTWWWVITLSVVLTIAFSLAGGFAFGFFFLLGLLGLLCGYILYLALTKMPVRNPLKPPRPTIGEEWADGQPLGRSEANEDDIARKSEDRAHYHELTEALNEHVTEDARKEAAQHDPEDYEGSPPVNPFP